MTRRWIALAMASALMMGTAAAQERPDAFPSRSIKIVVPFPAGGPSDVLARMIGQKMSEDWGQPVVVENRPGANTVLGAQQVAKAAPDGYTLLMAIDSTLAMNQYLYRTPPYDPFTDFVPVTLTAKTIQLLIVNAASDVKTVKELIAKAKIQPGKLARRQHRDRGRARRQNAARRLHPLRRDGCHHGAQSHHRQQPVV